MDEKDVRQPGDAGFDIDTPVTEEPGVAKGEASESVYVIELEVEVEDSPSAPGAGNAAEAATLAGNVGLRPATITPELRTADDGASNQAADEAPIEVELVNKPARSTRIIKWAALTVMAAGAATVGVFMMLRNGAEKAPVADPDQAITTDVADAAAADKTNLDAFGQVSDYGYEQALFAATNRQ